MAKLAVIKTGGKQYKVSEKGVIKIEKVAGNVGDPINFDQVLLLADGENIEAGKPLIEGKKVEAKILEHGRSRKVIVAKYKAKTRYRKRSGHRQMFTKVEITKV